MTCYRKKNLCIHASRNYDDLGFYSKQTRRYSMLSKLLILPEEVDELENSDWEGDNSSKLRSRDLQSKNTPINLSSKQKLQNEDACVTNIPTSHFERSERPSSARGAVTTQREHLTTNGNKVPQYTSSTQQFSKCNTSQLQETSRNKIYAQQAQALSSTSPSMGKDDSQKMSFATRQQLATVVAGKHLIREQSATASNLPINPDSHTGNSFLAVETDLPNRLTSPHNLPASQSTSITEFSSSSANIQDTQGHFLTNKHPCEPKRGFGINNSSVSNEIGKCSEEIKFPTLKNMQICINYLYRKSNTTIILPPHDFDPCLEVPSLAPFFCTRCNKLRGIPFYEEYKYWKEGTFYAQPKNFCSCPGEQNEAGADSNYNEFLATSGNKIPQFSSSNKWFSELNATQLQETSEKNIYLQQPYGNHSTYLANGNDSSATLLSCGQNLMGEQLATGSSLPATQSSSSSETQCSAVETNFLNASTSHHHTPVSQSTQDSALSSNPPKVKDSQRHSFTNRPPWEPEPGYSFPCCGLYIEIGQCPPSISCPILKNIQLFLNELSVSSNDIVTLPAHAFEPRLEVPALAPFFCICCNKIRGTPFYEEYNKHFKEGTFYPQHESLSRCMSKPNEGGAENISEYLATHANSMLQFSPSNKQIPMLNPSQTQEFSGNEIYPQQPSALSSTSLKSCIDASPITPFSSGQKSRTVASTYHSMEEQSATNLSTKPTSPCSRTSSFALEADLNVSIPHQYLNAFQSNSINDSSCSPANVEDTQGHCFTNRPSWESEQAFGISNCRVNIEIGLCSPGIFFPTLKNTQLFLNKLSISSNEFITIPAHAFEPHLDVPALAPFFCICCNKIRGIPFYEKYSHWKDGTFYPQPKNHNSNKEIQISFSNQTFSRLESSELKESSEHQVYTQMPYAHSTASLLSSSPAKSSSPGQQSASQQLIREQSPTASYSYTNPDPSTRTSFSAVETDFPSCSTYHYHLPAPQKIFVNESSSFSAKVEGSQGHFFTNKPPWEPEPVFGMPYCGLRIEIGRCSVGTYFPTLKNKHLFLNQLSLSSNAIITLPNHVFEPIIHVPFLTPFFCICCNKIRGIPFYEEYKNWKEGTLCPQPKNHGGCTGEQNKAGAVCNHSELPANNSNKMPQFSPPNQQLSPTQQETSDNRIYPWLPPVQHSFLSSNYTNNSSIMSFPSGQQAETNVSGQHSVRELSTTMFNLSIKRTSPTTRTSFSADDNDSFNATISHHHIPPPQSTSVKVLSSYPAKVKDSQGYFFTNRPPWEPERGFGIPYCGLRIEIGRCPPGILFPTLKNMQLFRDELSLSSNAILTLPTHAFKPHLDVPSLTPFYCICCNKIRGIPFHEKYKNLREGSNYFQSMNEFECTEKTW